MTSDLVSGVRRRAEALSDASSVVMGPLRGYHHETYVLDLPGGRQTVKFREPRAEILWYDRRCFMSEEELLRALRGHITRIPEVHDIAGMSMQEFIVGRTLGSRPWAGRSVPDPVFVQIVDLFREMSRITPATLSAVERRCTVEDRPKDGDTRGFLERLIVFTEEQVYQKNSARFEGLFTGLGVGGDAFVRIRERALGMERRPFCLLHADLHRENLILDPQGRLWAIDWELAMLGDPLYDLATHIYLTKFPADQEDRMKREWRRVIDGTLTGGSDGMERDLPVLLDFKRVQSVFTDVIRVSLSLCEGGDFNWASLLPAARKLHRVLGKAAEPLGLKRMPGLAQIVAELVRWSRKELPEGV
ncbi:aminoglycoside phosphotransferase family protein [Streptomyces sp. NPDC005648]|uniref:aminoglycoside phosphotransferase family protein n=1 Tax=Streptomyces sp. NPDC005648 TaxID=3157044 RepID=UPI0033A2AFA7